jgi:hypothetical protein
VLAGAGGRQEHRLLIEVGGDGALRLLGEASGFETDSAGAETAVIENGFCGGDFRTFQEVSLFLFWRALRNRCGGAVPFFTLAHPYGAQAFEGAGTGRLSARDSPSRCTCAGHQ